MVVIGTREIYELLIEVRDTVTDLAADQEATAKDIGELNTATKSLTARVNALEKWRWLVTGAAAAGGAVLTKVLESIAGG